MKPSIDVSLVGCYLFSCAILTLVGKIDGKRLRKIMMMMMMLGGGVLMAHDGLHRDYTVK